MEKETIQFGEVSLEEYAEREAKRLRKLKTIATWFAMIQSVWVVFLLFLLSGTWVVWEKINGRLVIISFLLYFTALLLLTLSVVIKNKYSQSIRLVKPKLIVVFVLSIIPIAFVFVTVTCLLILKIT